MKTFQERVQALIDAGNDIVRPDDSHYLHVPTGTKLMRTTNWITGAEDFVMPEAWAGASLIGTDCDQMVRDYFVDGPESVTPDKYEHLSRTAFTQLSAAIKAYDASVVKPHGWKVLADRVFLYSLELGVAGEVDLILYNEETEQIKIIDMKTVRSPQYNTPGSKKVKKYTRQLNTYRTMAEELTGGSVDALEIMWIKVYYEKYESTTVEAYLHNMETIPMSDVKKEVEKIWMETRGIHWSEYTTDKGHSDNPIQSLLTKLK